MAKQQQNKRPAKKRVDKSVWDDNPQWNVHKGKLVPTPGRPSNKKRLFKVVAEKIPFGALDSVKDDMAGAKINAEGVYIAHDSMGYPRYIGRGDIFARLKARKKAQVLELTYFSFYVVAEKNHEREIETLLIRAAGPMLVFNKRKKGDGILPGLVTDYEPRTVFYERQYKKGPKPNQKKG